MNIQSTDIILKITDNLSDRETLKLLCINKLFYKYLINYHYKESFSNNLLPKYGIVTNVTINDLLDLSKINSSKIKQLTFEHSFNQSLSKELNNLTNLTHLTFGSSFDKPLSKELNNLTNLTHLTFGYHFNQSLSKELNDLTNLTQLCLDSTYDKSLIDIPKSVLIIRT